MYCGCRPYQSPSKLWAYWVRANRISSQPASTAIKVRCARVQRTALADRCTLSGRSRAHSASGSNSRLTSRSATGVP